MRVKDVTRGRVRPPTPVAKLFHGIVVVGAALGCSGRSEHVVEDGSSGQPGEAGGSAPGGMGGIGASGGTGAVATNPADCAYPAQFECADIDLWSGCIFTPRPECDTDTARNNCYCDPGAPRDAEDCPATQQFTCYPGTYDDQVVACRCDPDAALDPADCAAPQQFHCRSINPETECFCDPDAPLTAAECSSLYRFECRSYDPPTDCECVSTIITR